MRFDVDLAVAFKVGLDTAWFDDAEVDYCDGSTVAVSTAQAEEHDNRDEKKKEKTNYSNQDAPP